ncbi:hypothetical protein [Micavibrio aeruginosavorus]|uniref:Uncharacterized protein n=1 Tax=Micavibrio aeruginosavorus EPB TaxID=349215 RepID=M4VGQ8_9BACT|nr:hypothetical protein [Micavibrio aeruginosavorus]AGH97665.1 hypothetical protein A11S_842 [Micavibrio aeruginosavorus EPB]
MNVKISGNSITFKISEFELNALIEQGVITQETRFDTGVFVTRIIFPADDNADPIKFLVSNVPDGGACIDLSFGVTHKDISFLSAIGKNREGLSMKSGNIDVTLQVDIRKDSRGRKAV